MAHLSCLFFPQQPSPHYSSEAASESVSEWQATSLSSSSAVGSLTATKGAHGRSYRRQCPDLCSTLLAQLRPFMAWLLHVVSRSNCLASYTKSSPRQHRPAFPVCAPPFHNTFLSARSCPFPPSHFCSWMCPQSPFLTLTDALLLQTFTALRSEIWNYTLLN